MKLEKFINLMSMLNSQPLHERNVEDMLNELLRNVKRYSISGDEVKIPLEIVYKGKKRRIYTVVTVDRDKKLLLINWVWLKPQDHEIMKEKEYERRKKVEKKQFERFTRIYFKLKQ